MACGSATKSSYLFFHMEFNLTPPIPIPTLLLWLWLHTKQDRSCHLFRYSLVVEALRCTVTSYRDSWFKTPSQSGHEIVPSFMMRAHGSGRAHGFERPRNDERCCVLILRVEVCESLNECVLQRKKTFETPLLTIKITDLDASIEKTHHPGIAFVNYWSFSNSSSFRIVTPEWNPLSKRARDRSFNYNEGTWLGEVTRQWVLLNLNIENWRCLWVAECILQI